MSSQKPTVSGGVNFLRGSKGNRKMKAKVGNGVDSTSEVSPLLGTAVTTGTQARRPPSDLCFTTYLIFGLMGVGHLLPWNFFITAHSYFEYKFTCNTTVNVSGHSCSPSLKNDFENYFSVAAMLPVCVMTAINIWLQSKIHYKYRMVFSLVGMFLLFMVTVILVKIESSSWVNGFFAVTILSVIFLNVCSAVFQSSTFGFSGVFPPQYTTVVLSGQGVAGIVAALALIFSKLATSNHPTTSALIYFCIATAIILICMGGLIAMIRLKFVRHFLAQTTMEVRRSIIASSTNARLETSPPFLHIFRQIVVYAVSVFLVFAVTLSLFPGVLSHLKSNSADHDNSGWTGTYFNPLVCFLMFNCSDFCGRHSTQFFSSIEMVKNRWFIFVVSIVRVGFIPLFLLCNVGQDDTDSLVPMYFSSDIVSIALVALLGLTNGFFGGISMMAAPMSLPPDQRETAATIMVFFLSFGLLSGSSLSFAWTKGVLKLKP